MEVPRPGFLLMTQRFYCQILILLGQREFLKVVFKKQLIPILYDFGSLIRVETCFEGQYMFSFCKEYDSLTVGSRVL